MVIPSWLRWLPAMFGIVQPEPLDPEQEAELRRMFRTRFHHFNLLLTANNRALEAMTEIEESLSGHTPFGVNYVRTLCIRIASSVHQIITNLNELTGDRYPRLMDRYHAINGRVKEIVAPPSGAEQGGLVLGLREITMAHVDQVGDKMASLGELSSRLGLAIPGGFAITAAAYRRFIAHKDLRTEIDRIIQATDCSTPDAVFRLSSQIQQTILAADMDSELEDTILEHFDALARTAGPDLRVALRSSALGEDSLRASFAGQYASELNVGRDSLIPAYKQVVASKYGVTGMTYRFNRGIPDSAVDMCVGCMTMVDARAGGVTYTRNPLDIRDDSVVINAAPGLPKAVVDGRFESDLFLVSRGEDRAVTSATTPRKSRKYIMGKGEGIRPVELDPEEAGAPSLARETILALAAMAERLEEFYGRPQDVEWAEDRSGNIILLQCRPLQMSYAGMSDKRRDALRSSVQGKDPDNLLWSGGLTASSGIGSGKVFLVRKQADTLRFPDNAVLVAMQALPQWASLLSKASAVITVQGSIAGHLANVAREFRVPALFGVTQAFELLEQDQEITLDADLGRIYTGRVEALLDIDPPKPHLMEDSPVLDMLKQAAAHIVPLNLLDPDSVDFRPANCETYHDITRFCHERAVRDMFHYGQDTPFPQMSSKQLHYKVPMQYWVLDLDDGFKRPVKGRYVHMEDIASTPMLRLWDGMIAVPWAGPPAMNARGFLSVVFEATTNPDLSVSRTSNFAVRNYFMISRKFMSLQSRFGFHFGTVEALVGDRKLENYVSFQFKGGAADENRRVRRAHFVGWILERYGFRTEVRMDALFARLEGMDREHMEDCLKVLGYLLIHTRQLDMIMHDDAAVARHRDSIMHDLEEVMAIRRIA